MNLTPAEREVLAPHLERAARDLAELTAMLDPDVLRTLMALVEALSDTHRHPRQILHNGRKPR